ncbi:MAG: hypothetical protein KF805_07975 [Phycisphaeraceae bacterium]|nr:hypothetical protein [Phycisphaeraceae bacterium]
MNILRSAHGIAVAMLVLLSAASHAQPILIDFEQVPGMGNAPGAPIPPQSRLSDFYLASHGVRFFSGAPFVAVVVHGANTPSGVQIIGGSNPEGTLTYQNSHPVEAAFFDASGTLPYVVSTVSIRGDLQPIPGTKTLEAYSLNGALLAFDTQLDSNPAPLAISAPGIHHIRMYSQSATVGFDDLRFDTPVAPALCPGDLNNDGLVDDTDFVLFVAAYNILDCADPSMPASCPADLNSDGFVDDSDFVGFVAAYNELVCP